MMRTFPLSSLCLALLTLPVQAATFHVSPRGNDGASGSADAPFATLERAYLAARKIQEEPVTLTIHGGTYFLTRPLTLTAEDTRSARAPLRCMAAAGERPVLSGGRALTGWKETEVNGHKLWVAEVPAVKEGKWFFHQLWINGQRRPRARHPNKGFFTIESLPDVKPGTPRYPGQNRFIYHKGDLKKWKNLQDLEVVVLHLWVGVRLPVAALDEKDRLVTFTTASKRMLVEGNKPARYYVENALELLDTPGEWYLDRHTGQVYYWPLPGESIPRTEAIAPVLPHVLQLQGKPEKKQYLEHLTFHGLTFAHTENWPAQNDSADTQAAANVASAVQGDGLRHCRWDQCTIAHTGAYGVHLARGCQECQVTQCDLFDLGGGGIKIGEMTNRDDPAQQTAKMLISDNHIHEGGLVFPQAVGLWVGQSYDNALTHNHIHDLFYTGISVGWTWGYGKTLARGNRIEYNLVHDLGKEVLSDMGGIYTLGTQPGTVVRHNVFHDINGYAYGGWGIYFDEGSTAIVAENNLVYRTSHGGFHQHYGKDNVVRNNIFAFGRHAQVRRTRVEAHRSFTFEHNLVYYTQGKLFDGRWDGAVTLAHNLYWKVGGAIPASERQIDPKSLFVDPLFLDPEKGNFQLKADSPARKIGFKPFRVNEVGPRPVKNDKQDR